MTSNNNVKLGLVEVGITRFARDPQVGEPLLKRSLVLLEVGITRFARDPLVGELLTN